MIVKAISVMGDAIAFAKRLNEKPSKGIARLFSHKKIAHLLAADKKMSL
jgi:hypothetical protein